MDKFIFGMFYIFFVYRQCISFMIDELMDLDIGQVYFILEIFRL